MSLPPKCGGPRLIGLDIDTLQGVEERAGTRWVSAARTRVVGTWDGADITLTHPPEQLTFRQPRTGAPPTAPTGYGEAQLRAIQSQVGSALQGPWSGHISDGWVHVRVGVIDRSLIAAPAAAVDDPAPSLLLGQVELLQ